MRVEGGEGREGRGRGKEGIMQRDAMGTLVDWLDWTGLVREWRDMLIGVLPSLFCMLLFKNASFIID